MPAHGSSQQLARNATMTRSRQVAAANPFAAAQARAAAGGSAATQQQQAVSAYLQALAAARAQQPGPSSGPSFSSGGFNTEAPAPSYDPNTDPAYQSLLRSIGVQEDDARRMATSKIGMAQREAAELTPRVAEKGQEERRGINASLEARGLFRGGERLRRLGLQQQQEQQHVGDIERQTANRVQDIQAALQQQINDLARQRADAALQASYRAAR